MTANYRKSLIGMNIIDKNKEFLLYFIASQYLFPIKIKIRTFHTLKVRINYELILII